MNSFLTKDECREVNLETIYKAWAKCHYPEYGALISQPLVMKLPPEIVGKINESLDNSRSQ